MHRTTLVGVSVVEFPKAFESQLLQRCRAPAALGKAQGHAKMKNSVFVAFWASRMFFVLRRLAEAWRKDEKIFIEKQAFEKQGFVGVFREQPAARAGF